MEAGHFLDGLSGRFPEAVLGAQAAQILQINQVGGHVLVYLGNTWFQVIGILKPALLDSSLDSTVFISLPIAERMFDVKPNPSRSTSAPTRTTSSRYQPTRPHRRSAERRRR